VPAVILKAIMEFQNPEINQVAQQLQQRFSELTVKADILKATELKALYDGLRLLPNDQKAAYGKELNLLKQQLVDMVNAQQQEANALPPIDVTAPMDVNSPLPAARADQYGSIHPISREIERVASIFKDMGFEVAQSREIDDQYHMFDTLNFPKGHPARDDYDTFLTKQKDSAGEPLIAPAHTSTMENRVMKERLGNLEKGEPIAVVIPDRVFRNEDVDARHDHTFYQLEGVYIDKGVHAGMLVATLQTFLEKYYGSALEVRLNPYYFPFTEPSFEFSLSCPFCNKAGCKVCSFEGWIELIGCGMTHPNVLREAGIDPAVYSGFAWGCGIDRLVMMKYQIEDIRHFHSGKLDFLEQF
jgi:phenylalanyl-tRNA synthetase alpha chain